jgi:hypothetical protein
MGLRTDSKCPLCQHEDGGSPLPGLPRQENGEDVHITAQCSVATGAEVHSKGSMGAASSLQWAGKSYETDRVQWAECNQRGCCRDRQA